MINEMCCRSITLKWIMSNTQICYVNQGQSYRNVLDVAWLIRVFWPDEGKLRIKTILLCDIIIMSARWRWHILYSRSVVSDVGHRIGNEHVCRAASLVSFCRDTLHRVSAVSWPPLFKSRQFSGIDTSGWRQRSWRTDMPHSVWRDRISYLRPQFSLSDIPLFSLTCDNGKMPFRFFSYLIRSLKSSG